MTSNEIALPKDSLDRVAEMSRLRREREMGEQQVWEQNSRVAAEHERFVAETISAFEEDEMNDRFLIIKAEGKSAEVLQQFASSAKAASPAYSDLARRRNELTRLTQRALFNEFCRSRITAPSQDLPRRQEDPSVTARRDAVAVLRHAYAHSSVPFASDPEDLWRRGIAVAPDLQRSGIQPDVAHHELRLPSYHDFAIAMRHKYELHRQASGK